MPGSEAGGAVRIVRRWDRSLSRAAKGKERRNGAVTVSGAATSDRASHTHSIKSIGSTVWRSHATPMNTQLLHMSPRRMHTALSSYVTCAFSRRAVGAAGAAPTAVLAVACVLAAREPCN